MVQNLTDLIDCPELQSHLGKKATSIHEGGKSGEITEPVKSGVRASRWPRYEALLMQKAVLAECTKTQRIELATFLSDARKSTKTAEDIYGEGMDLITQFVSTNGWKAA